MKRGGPEAEAPLRAKTVAGPRPGATEARGETEESPKKVRNRKRGRRRASGANAEGARWRNEWGRGGPEADAHTRAETEAGPRRLGAAEARGESEESPERVRRESGEKPRRREGTGTSVGHKR